MNILRAYRISKKQDEKVKFLKKKIKVSESQVIRTAIENLTAEKLRILTPRID